MPQLKPSVKVRVFQLRADRSAVERYEFAFNIPAADTQTMREVAANRFLDTHGASNFALRACNKCTDGSLSLIVVPPNELPKTTPIKLLSRTGKSA